MELFPRLDVTFDFDFFVVGDDFKSATEANLLPFAKRGAYQRLTIGNFSKIPVIKKMNRYLFSIVWVSCAVHSFWRVCCELTRSEKSAAQIKNDEAEKSKRSNT
jgi:hypothetical protein